MAEHHLFKHINGSLYGIVCLNNIASETVGREREKEGGRQDKKHLFEGK